MLGYLLFKCKFCQNILHSLVRLEGYSTKPLNTGISNKLEKIFLFIEIRKQKQFYQINVNIINRIGIDGIELQLKFISPYT